MLPVGGLLIFFKQYIVQALASPNSVPWDEIADSDLDDDDEDDKEKEEKKSLKERLQAIQEVTQSVQNAIGRIASLLESVKKYLLLKTPVTITALLILILALSTLRFRIYLG